MSQKNTDPVYDAHRPNAAINPMGGPTSGPMYTQRMPKAEPTEVGDAWHRICKALDDACPAWLHIYPGTAIEAAEKCIHDLGLAFKAREGKNPNGTLRTRFHHD